MWELRSLLAISTMGSLMNKNEILHEHCSSTDDTRYSENNCLEIVRALPNTHTLGCYSHLHGVGARPSDQGVIGPQGRPKPQIKGKLWMGMSQGPGTCTELAKLVAMVGVVPSWQPSHSSCYSQHPVFQGHGEPAVWAMLI